MAGKSQLTLRLRLKDGKYGREPTSSLDDGEGVTSLSGVMAVADATHDCVVDDDAKVDVVFGVIESLLTDAATDGGCCRGIDLIDVIHDDESKDIAFRRFLE